MRTNSEPPLCIDLFCGLGGWAQGFIAEGYRVIGFDIERHDYGTGTYPGHLVIQDVRTLHGSQFRNAAVIVASPPCQEYSYRAMPWKRAKALPPPSNALFEACFRIQREVIEAAGHYVPMIVENVYGAQKWVGRAAWHYGSYYLWGDVPALMPFAKVAKVPGLNWKVGSATYCGKASSTTAEQAIKVPSFRFDGSGSQSASVRRTNVGNGVRFTTRDCGIEGVKVPLSGRAWYAEGLGRVSSKCPARRAASAEIAKIPFPLAQYIARCYAP